MLFLVLKGEAVAWTSNISDMREQITSGTVNLWLEPGTRADLALIIEPNQRLVLTLH